MLKDFDFWSRQTLREKAGEIMVSWEHDRNVKDARLADFQEQIKAKDKWINELLKENDSLIKERDNKLNKIDKMFQDLKNGS